MSSSSARVSPTRVIHQVFMCHRGICSAKKYIWDMRGIFGHLVCDVCQGYLQVIFSSTCLSWGSLGQLIYIEQSHWRQMSVSTYDSARTNGWNIHLQHHFRLFCYRDFTRPNAKMDRWAKQLWIFSLMPQLYWERRCNTTPKPPPTGDTVHTFCITR